MFIKEWLEQELTEIQCFIVIDEALKRYRHYDEIPWEFKRNVYRAYLNYHFEEHLEADMKDCLAISKARGLPVQNFGHTDSLLFVGIDNRLTTNLFNKLIRFTRHEHYKEYDN